MGCSGSKSGGAGNAKQKSKSQYDLAGGHAQNIVFDGNKMTKKTKKSEVDNYTSIFGGADVDGPGINSLKQMKEFVSTFHSGEKIPDDEKGMWSITIENLLFERENASFMDIKLGTTSLTSGSNEEKA